MPITETRDALITRLQESLVEKIGPLEPEPFALMDFPDHSNVGDSAIWVGEIEFFRERHKRAPSYVCSFNNYDEDTFNTAVPDGPIFLHGGGNFGDIWPHHQLFRERIIGRWKDRRIIQLPQSIHYGDKSQIARTARVIAAHKKFLLLVRDKESLEFAQKHFDCETRLCPDSAFAIGAISARQPKFDVLAMLRTDKEFAPHVSASSVQGAKVDDWLEENRQMVRLAKLTGVARAILSGKSADRMALQYDAAARFRVARGVRQLAGARAIVTDRLHVHIIALLLGRPHAVLDNSYGKIGRFMASFSGTTALTHRAESMEDALAWATHAAANSK